MRINTNLNAMTALNQSTKNTALAGTSMGKISSGQRINKAGDDAAGLAISEKMRSQIRGMEQADRNTQDGISLVQTAEGATEEVGNIVQRMRELAVQSANETNTASDRTKITEGLTQLHQEIDRISDSTQFNGKNILNGDTKIGDAKVVSTKDEDDSKFKVEGLSLSEGQEAKLKTEADGTDNTKVTVTVGSEKYEVVIAKTTKPGDVAANAELTLTDKNTGKEIKVTVVEALADPTAETKIAGTETTLVDVKGSKLNLQVGANTSASEGLEVKAANIKTSSLGLTQAGIDAMKADGEDGTTAAKAMIGNLDKALETINTSRANLGVMQNRLETTSSNLTTSTENLSAAESRIRDVDVAKEMMTLSKLNLLTQASQAMAMQAKSQPEGVMQLLR